MGYQKRKSESAWILLETQITTTYTSTGILLTRLLLVGDRVGLSGRALDGVVGDGGRQRGIGGWVESERGRHYGRRKGRLEQLSGTSVFGLAGDVRESICL